MTAKEQMKLMLDKLMGKERNGDAKTSKVKFDDRNVCKAYLLGFCPYDMIKGTRRDVEHCEFVHDISLISEYEEAKHHKNYFYEIELYEALKTFLNRTDHNINMSKEILRKQQASLDAAKMEAEEVNKELEKEIEETEKMLETCTELGGVDETSILRKKIEDLKNKKDSNGEEIMSKIHPRIRAKDNTTLCSICGVYISSSMVDFRVINHNSGKLHIAYAEMRAKLAELEDIITKILVEREVSKQMEGSITSHGSYEEKTLSHQKINSETSHLSSTNSYSPPSENSLGSEDRRSQSPSKKSRSRHKCRHHHRHKHHRHADHHHRHKRHKY